MEAGQCVAGPETFAPGWSVELKIGRGLVGPVDVAWAALVDQTAAGSADTWRRAWVFATRSTVEALADLAVEDARAQAWAADVAEAIVLVGCWGSLAGWTVGNVADPWLACSRGSK